MTNKFSIFNFQFSKIAKAVFVVSAIVFLSAGCNWNQESGIRDQELTGKPQAGDNQSKQIWVSQSVNGVENPVDDFLLEPGTSALDLLKMSYQVETKTFSGIGEYVVSINGQKEDTGKNFWALYVNDKQSQVGASSYYPKDGDKIVWKLEEIR